jgi:hypothetical protein
MTSKTPAYIVKMMFAGNVINLRKRIMPDTSIPFDGIKISGILLF